MALAAWSILTMDEAKEFLGIVGASEDVLVESLVMASTLRCETETARKLVSRTYTDEKYNGTGNASLRLRQYPVTAVSAWNLLTTDAPEAWTPQSLTTYPVVVAEPVKDTIVSRNTAFAWGVMNHQLTYTAGLTSIPEDLKTACRLILMDLWKQKDKVLAGVASQSFNGQSVTYRNDEIPVAAASLLMPYRRLV